MLERLSDANRARWFLLGSVLVTGTLYTIPYGWYVAYPLVLLSTYVHEIAHGLAAALVGGQFDSLVIHADGSGVASTSGNSGRFAFAFVAGAGLVGQVPRAIAVGSPSRLWPAGGRASRRWCCLSHPGLPTEAGSRRSRLVCLAERSCPDLGGAKHLWLVLRRIVGCWLRRRRVAGDCPNCPSCGCVPRGATGAQRVLAG